MDERTKHIQTCPRGDFASLFFSAVDGIYRDWRQREADATGYSEVSLPDFETALARAKQQGVDALDGQEEMERIAMKNFRAVKQ